MRYTIRICVRLHHSNAVFLPIHLLLAEVGASNPASHTCTISDITQQLLTGRGSMGACFERSLRVLSFFIITARCRALKAAGIESTLI